MNEMGESDYGGARSAPPTLFLLCTEPRVSDPAWLGTLLSRSGFLGDGDDGRASAFPIHAHHWAIAIGVEAGPPAHGALMAALQSIEPNKRPSLAGLDVAPDINSPHILALTITRLPVASRAQAVQKLAFMAAALSDQLGASALYWPPAQLWSSALELSQAVVAMEAQGLPPLLHFISFFQDNSPNPADHRMMTAGLGWMVGHEIELVAPVSMMRPEMLRRIARLAVDTMTHGAYSSPTRVAGLVRGEVIDIAPVDSSGAVRIVRAKVTV
ncbi:MAG: hypothetical protein ABL909_08005 [Sphingopyxis sp.]